MFPDGWKMKKTGWYTKLMYFTWRKNYNDFDWGCPFFWITIINVLLFVTLITPLIRGVIYLTEAIFDAYDNAMEAWIESYALAMKNNPKLEARILRLNKIGGKWSRLMSHLQWKDNDYANTLWEKIHVSQEEKDDIQKKYRKMVEERNRRAKDSINKIARIAKPIGKAFLVLLGTAAAVFLIWVLYLFFNWLTHIHHKQWIGFFKVLGIIVGGVIALLAVVGTIIYLTKDIKKENIKIRISPKVLHYVGAPFRAIWYGIKVVVTILRDNCPKIIWVD